MPIVFHFSSQDGSSFHGGISVEKDGRILGRVGTMSIDKTERSVVFFSELKRLGIRVDFPNWLSVSDVDLQSNPKQLVPVTKRKFIKKKGKP